MDQTWCKQYTFGERYITHDYYGASGKRLQLPCVRSTQKREYKHFIAPFKLNVRLCDAFRPLAINSNISYLQLPFLIDEQNDCGHLDCILVEYAMVCNRAEWTDICTQRMLSYPYIRNDDDECELMPRVKRLPILQLEYHLREFRSKQQWEIFFFSSDTCQIKCENLTVNYKVEKRETFENPLTTRSMPGTVVVTLNCFTVFPKIIDCLVKCRHEVKERATYTDLVWLYTATARYVLVECSRAGGSDSTRLKNLSNVNIVFIGPGDVPSRGILTRLHHLDNVYLFWVADEQQAVELIESHGADRVKIDDNETAWERFTAICQGNNDYSPFVQFY